MPIISIIIALFLTSNALADKSIILLGDAGTGEKDQYKVSKAIEGYCKLTVCDFVLLLGDNFYPKGVKSVEDPQWQDKFEKPYANVSLKFFPVLGNHDYDGNEDAQIKYRSDKWFMADRYFCLSDSDVQIMGLDTEKFDDKQIEWIKKSFKDSQAKIKIVYGHHPIYSGGMHGDTSELKKKLLPILKENGVNLYASGHDHDLQLLEDGQMVFVVSGAGSKKRNVNRTKRTVFAKSTLGFSHLLVTNESMTVKMIDKKGQTIFEKKYAYPGG